MQDRDWQKLSDDELVAIAQGRGDAAQRRRAASALLDRYRGHVLRWCRRFRPEGEEAIDLAQEILLAAYRNLPQFAGRSRFPSWLFTITRRRCLDEMRRRRPLLEALHEDLELTDPRADTAGAHDRERAEMHLRNELAAHLAPDEQDAIWLRYVEGFTVEEIEVALRPAGASGARGLLQRARRRLRAKWRRDDDGKADT